MRARMLSSLRRTAAMNPFIADLIFSVTIAGVSMVFGLVLSQDAALGYAQRPWDAVGVGLTLVVSLVLAWRRRAPLTVLAVACVTEVVFHLLGYDVRLNEVAPLLALYTVTSRRLPAVSVPCAFAVAVAWWHAAFLGPDDFTWPNIIQISLIVVVAWLFGNQTRMLRERNAQLARLTERLRRDQENRARRAVTEERVRIARELHDVVAHHMSVIVIQAGLARYVFGSDPATARGALATIADTGSEVMGEMRRLLAVLRIDANDGADDDADECAESYDPAPGLDRLDQLTERVRSAGVPVEVSITGTVRPLPPGVDLCAYRIVQECLTNVLKHAGPATARVSLSYGAELELRVSDDGRGAPATPEGDGHGLIGMRERVKLYRGTVKTGSKPSGGFEVVVTLPLPSPGTDTQPLAPAGEPSG
ncbi:sensor histidine kinase [Streptosporangium sandarakinum]|uniref:sensor histidine kinase n=1 Tax=Streptosporangium sandarakinum TaxID=1260955 RepID=UPI00371B49B9